MIQQQQQQGHPLISRKMTLSTDGNANLQQCVLHIHNETIVGKYLSEKSLLTVWLQLCHCGHDRNHNSAPNDRATESDANFVFNELLGKLLQLKLISLIKYLCSKSRLVLHFKPRMADKRLGLRPYKDAALQDDNTADADNEEFVEEEEAAAEEDDDVAEEEVKR
ncbi:hypothetical protein FF38_09838 [Lucilia cuprina]|uniref:Uncharacterized protein n=1 Tax=Lucilia cuprina TaxID=7375 RepID=A0A0L0CPS3_LUCCU|nr:hypothetical protein FF38_09838 [Lucilia cuprina]